MKSLPLLTLLAILAGLLVYLVVTDHPSPAHPRGELADLVPQLVVLLLAVAGVYGIVAAIIRNRRGSSFSGRN